MKQHKSIKIDADLIAKVQERADKEKRSFNNMVEVLLSDAINGNFIAISNNIPELLKTIPK